MANLSSFESMLLWMAVRYAMNRQTIAASTLPTDIISEWYKRFKPEDKQRLVFDLKRNLEDNGDKAFGDPNIDRPTWMKFLAALDEPNHYQVRLLDGTEWTVFDANGRTYTLKHYLENPHSEIFIDFTNVVWTSKQ